MLVLEHLYEMESSFVSAQQKLVKSYLRIYDQTSDPHAR
jgi:hypothetical protein